MSHNLTNYMITVHNSLNCLPMMTTGNVPVLVLVLVTPVVAPVMVLLVAVVTEHVVDNESIHTSDGLIVIGIFEFPNNFRSN